MRNGITALILLVTAIGWAHEPALNPILNLELGSDPLPRCAPDWGEPVQLNEDPTPAEPRVGFRLAVPEMRPRPVALDFAFPIETEEKRRNPRQIETPPVRFDAPPTFAATTYLR